MITLTRRRTGKPNPATTLNESPSAVTGPGSPRWRRWRDLAVSGVAYTLMFGFWAVAAGLSANGLIGFGRDNMQLAEPWPYLLFLALDGAAGMCAVLLVRRATRAESATAPRLAVWGLVAASAWFNWTHAPDRPGAHQAFALMPIIAGVLFEFALHETRHQAGRADRRMTAVRWLHPIERVRVQMELAGDEGLAVTEATRRVRVGRAAHHLIRLRRLTHDDAWNWRQRLALRRVQAALHRADVANPDIAVDVIRQVQVAVQAQRLATLDYSSPEPAREVLHSLITPAAVSDIVTVLNDADAARSARQAARRRATRQAHSKGDATPQAASMSPDAAAPDGATPHVAADDVVADAGQRHAVGVIVSGMPSSGEGDSAGDTKAAETADEQAGADPLTQAAQIVADEPNITGAELGLRLGRGARTGQRLLKRLKESDSATAGIGDTTSDTGPRATDARDDIRSRRNVPDAPREVVEGDKRYDSAVRRSDISGDTVAGDVASGEVDARHLVGVGG
ncbi:DUF2637 domain-containing protein [Actinomadura sp. 6N118]|uniref:DUF2637 domain-containing protein n=1 Tax=Actinomadura sp. 6N118 TaxID=3375151 RepID=UPI0037B849B0